jgi:hypothetical protein
MNPNAEGATDFNRMNPFGPGASADETRQSQQATANDQPSYVNVNAFMTTSQMQTTDVYGKEFAAAAVRRTILADVGQALFKVG